MHALIALVTLAAALQAAAKPAPVAPPPSVITPPPVPIDAAVRARDEALTIPLLSCLVSIECCQMVLTLPVLPASLTGILAPLGLTAPIPIPTLGPMAGLICSPATDLDILGNQCLAGGTPLCCQETILGLVAEGCQEVINIPSITLPLSLPTISLPLLGGSSGLLGILSSLPLLGTGGGLLGLPLPTTLPPVLGNPAPTSSAGGLLGLPLPSLPLLGTGGGLLGLPLPTSTPLLGGTPTSTSGGLLGLLGLASEVPIPEAAATPTPPPA
ncbi:uncharacterized protein TRAVEDRAFT_75121 [Trametes versicolor FP-101664 SS1]|uniref:uncharacterized protein n=1 Tax=Trametes versicolor (strain FP-101664) TaxID=717944 RepID=UPI0004622320|nr:uncharacterized protein TRAVEDRAFT_75121 [Trametes versicolor FP-101664 SS1]EIW52870.1 hypothetical protein TRAVEDRAFT_75121 [Trametes versicolor FP-101664 SS1]